MSGVRRANAPKLEHLQGRWDANGPGSLSFSVRSACEDPKLRILVNPNVPDGPPLLNRTRHRNVVKPGDVFAQQFSACLGGEVA